MKEYLPLYWLNHFADDYIDKYKNILSLKEMEILTNDRHTKFEKKAVLRKKYKFAMLLAKMRLEEQDKVLSSIVLYSTLKLWNRNRQCYRFDKDFLNELMNTDTLHFAKDSWSFLPCDTFYVDISENQEICQRTGMQGFFAKVVPHPTKELWQIHLAMATEDSLNHGNFYAWNKDKDISIDNLPDTELTEILNEPVVLASQEENKQVNDISILVAQTLTYLSSIEPDIRDEQDEKPAPAATEPETSPEPSTKKKHSKQKEKSILEVRKWTVGVRFGNAYRKWTQSQHHDSGERTGKSYHVRPHYRKAHWQNYWYGKRDGERVRRPKWVAGTFVNENLAEELPVTIHKVSGQIEKGVC